ncbi:MAG: AAA family ATPase [Saprospiraceae bacterium]|nr:AAA family ATPase [Saprospiraceae bacterium]
MIERIYVAATSQHVGKTTSTLGLIAGIRTHGLKVGYCKPVGQEFVDLGDLKADKDALLFSKVMEFELTSDVHSPVIIGRGVTKEYLDNPDQFNFEERIMSASEKLQEINDVVVYEGTGHPGVGSVCNLSNARVAKMLNAGVVMVVPGGIGNTIDLLNNHLALFREHDVPVIGVIINKVIRKKQEDVRHYVGKKLEQMGIPLLGILPYDKSLANPIMSTVCHAVNGKVLLNGYNLDNKIENIMSGALAIREEIDTLKDMLLVSNYKRLDQAVRKIDKFAKKHNIEGSPISGIVLHGEGVFDPEIVSKFNCKSYLMEHEIPVIATSLDTYGSAVKISHIEVKINTRTPWKAQRAIEMIRDYVDFNPIVKGSL